MCDFHNFGLIFMGQYSLPQRLKSTLFENFSNGGCLKGARKVPGVYKKFQTTLILVFEVIVQPHGNIFDIFK